MGETLSPLFFYLGYNVGMIENESKLTEVEEFLQKKHDATEANHFPSTAGEVASSDRLEQLILPKGKRGRMPLTKDKYLIRENPHLIEWERTTREFLRNLSPSSGHRVSAAMVYEWATGIKIKELMAQGGSANSDLRKINQVLRYYFGDSYQTNLAGRKVGKAYRVPAGFYIRSHRPMTLVLWVEYREGTLVP